MTRSPSFAAVILAAGESSRMGRDKALLPWRGTTFLGGAIEALRSHAEMVVVVAGANAVNLRPIVYGAGVSLVINPEPERGQFSSLRVGLQEVLSRGRDAAIVTLVDRPPPSAAMLRQMVGGFRDTVEQGIWAVVPMHDGRHGHPVVMGREMIEAFLGAAATDTARDVQHRHQQHIRYIAVDDPAVVWNVNTPEDYQRITEDFEV